MNIFKDKGGIIGEVSIAHLNHMLEKFFEQAAEIRTMLGKQAYLLDEYISCLLEAAADIVAAPDSYEDDAMQLNNVCYSILRCNEKSKKNPFYQQAKEFIDAHHLPLQEIPTKHSIYSALLASDFLNFSAERFQKRIEYDYSMSADFCSLLERFNQICSLLGNEEDMERLNLLFRDRFLIASAIQIYLQGMTTQLMSVLTMRDRETQKWVFHIILEEQLFLSWGRLE